MRHIYEKHFFFFLAPSSPPTFFEASVINTTAIFLSWEPPPPEYQNGIIRQYVIELNPAELEDNITIVSTGRSVTVTNLRPYTLYECTVAAETILVGVSSSVQLARTHEAGNKACIVKPWFVLITFTFYAAPSAAPEELLVSITSPTTIQIEWLPPRNEDTNGVIRAYIISITEIDTGNNWQQTVENDTDEFIGSLHPFYSYSFSVAAETIMLGPFTSPTIIEMPEDGKYSSCYIHV